MTEALVNNNTTTSWLIEAVQAKNPVPGYRDEAVLIILRSPVLAAQDDPNQKQEFGYDGRGGLFYFCKPTLNRHGGNYTDNDFDALRTREKRPHETLGPLGRNIS